MIVGTLTIRYRDHRLANDVIEGVPQEVFRAMTVDLEIGDISSIQAFKVPTDHGEQVSIVKDAILSASFVPTGETEDISLPRWTHIR